jgi:putative transposase
MTTVYHTDNVRNWLRPPRVFVRECLAAPGTVCHDRGVPTEVRMVQQAFLFALDLTPAQRRACMSHAGGARYVHNWALARMFTALDAYTEAKTGGREPVPLPSHFDLCKEWTAYKNEHAADPDPEPGERRTNTAWVPQNFVGTYQAAARDAHTALMNFLASKRGDRAGPRLGRPKFKAKGRARDSFQVHGETLNLVDAHHAKLPKIGRVKTHESTRKLLRRLAKPDRPCPQCNQTGIVPAPAGAKGKKVLDCPSHQRRGCQACNGSGKVTKCPGCGGYLHVPEARIVRGTVSRNTDNRWYLSLTVEVLREIRTGPSQRQRDGGPIGIDFGVRELATLSTGEVISNPRYLRAALRDLARAQQTLSRRRPDSAGYRQAAARVARIHFRVKSLRGDYLQQLTTRLVHEHSLIAMEGFDVRQTAERGSRHLPRAVRRGRNQALHDAGIGMARWQIRHKAAWYGCTAVETPRNEPTGRTCSRCLRQKTNAVAPSMELFSCGDCGHTEPRRVNTARVVLRVGRGETSTPSSSGEVAKSGRGGGVSPVVARHHRRPPPKRQASTGPPGPGEPGTPSG